MRGKKLKVLVTLICIAMVFGSLVACGNGGNGGNGGNDDRNDNGAGGDTQQQFIIQFGHVEAEGNPGYIAAEEFARVVYERSNGRLVVHTLPAGVYGGEVAMTEATSMNILQMSTAATAVLTSYDSNFMLLDLPFLFDSRQQSRANLDGALGDALNELLPQFGLISFGYQCNGLRHITNNIRPIHAPDDLNGIMMRVMESPVFIEMFRLLGANPIPMSFTEVYMALAQGTVDGQENGPALVYTTRFFEVQRYYSLTGHVHSTNIVMMSADFYNNLPADLQQIVREEARRILVLEQREIMANLEDIFLERLIEEGMIVNEITPENMLLFMEAVLPMQDYFKGEHVEERFFDLIER